MSFQIRSINLCMLVASMKTVYHICVVIVDVKVAFLIFFLFTRNAHCCNVFSVTDDVYLCDWLQKKTVMKNDFTLNTFSYMYKYMKLSTQNYLRNLSGTRNQACRFRRIQNVAYFCRHFTSLAAWSMRHDGAHDIWVWQFELAKTVFYTSFGQAGTEEHRKPAAPKLRGMLNQTTLRPRVLWQSSPGWQEEVNVPCRCWQMYFTVTVFKVHIAYRAVY